MKRIIAMIALAAALACGAQNVTTPTYGVFYYQRASLFDELPVDSTDIVMLGNSLTNGCEWHELLGMPNVKNRGITSDVIQGIAERMQPIINGQPAKIFLMTGCNDVSHDLTADSIATAFGELIDMMREQMPRTKLYVQSLLPINISFGLYKRMEGKDPVIVEVNDKLAAMAQEKGYTYIDVYSAVVDDEGHLRRDFTNDGIHLLGPGYLAWRDTILPYVKE